ncbi:MAG: immune inhibitor A [Thermoplasmatales archaeon]|nr:MAG: immune inhibitor A [Thermoplasmatales archaeon]
MVNKNISIFILFLLLSTTIFANGISSKSYEEEKLLLVRIYTDYEILPRDFEIISIQPDEWIEVIITNKQLNFLEKSNFVYKILIEDVLEYENSVRGEYHTLAEIENILNNIANNFPDITSLYSIGTTYEGRDIWCLEITDNPGVDEGEPGVFFMGLHHAREWPTVEICLYLANELTSNYDIDPAITDVVDNTRIWLVTCVNPDGYYYCHDQGHDWRKNRQPYPPNIGVDLNRNYAGSSNGDPWGSWGSVGTGSISNHPSSDLYCGPLPFSEFETQATKEIFLNNDICAAISWHTHGELVLYPWAYSFQNTPDSDYISEVAQQIASRITQQSGSGSYTPTQGAGLYPTTGDTVDWAYGYGHYVLGRPTFTFTIEACEDFHPSESYLDQVCQENFDGAFYLLEEAENIRDTVARRVIPPIIDDMDEDGDGDYTVSWVEQNEIADPSYFQLDELSDLSLFTEDAESGTDSWIIEGFTISTQRYHSSSHSFKSRFRNQDVSSMVTVNPIPITQDMNLSFWCWYNIETEYDYAFVEVSRDGRIFDVIDKFTDSSSGWAYKEYLLDDYIGESIFIRFRYITDYYTQEEGFYVDDIYPIAEFGSINTLSDTITENHYDIINQPQGTYYYRVKGYNSAYEWGDYSTLEDIIVNFAGAPDTPDIEGPTEGKPGIEYNYTFVSTDLEGDDVFYYIDWGDGQFVEWIGPFVSGEEITQCHSWDTKGTYTIKAKAKDTNEIESDWGTLEVKIPRTKLFSELSIYRLLEKLSFIFYILKIHYFK